MEETKTEQSTTTKQSATTTGYYGLTLNQLKEEIEAIVAANANAGSYLVTTVGDHFNSDEKVVAHEPPPTLLSINPKLWLCSFGVDSAEEYGTESILDIKKSQAGNVVVLSFDERRDFRIANSLRAKYREENIHATTGEKTNENWIRQHFYMKQRYITGEDFVPKFAHDRFSFKHAEQFMEGQNRMEAGTRVLFFLWDSTDGGLGVWQTIDQLEKDYPFLHPSVLTTKFDDFFSESEKTPFLFKCKYTWDKFKSAFLNDPMKILKQPVAKNLEESGWTVIGSDATVIESDATVIESDAGCAAGLTVNSTERMGADEETKTTTEQKGLITEPKEVVTEPKITAEPKETVTAVEVAKESAPFHFLQRLQSRYAENGQQGGKEWIQGIIDLYKNGSLTAEQVGALLQNKN